MSEMLFPVSRHAAILGKRFFAWFLVGKTDIMLGEESPQHGVLGEAPEHSLGF